MHKFYTLEDLTQEELNKLSLERNTLDSNWNELKKRLEKRIETLSWMDKELLLSFKKKEINCIKEVLDEMQELEQGKDE